MPILRYRVGDWASATSRGCRCGRGLPLLQRIEGREADYVVLPDGRLVSGISLTENFALRAPGVVQLQIVQEGLHDLRFRVVPSPEFNEAQRQRFEELARERFGSDVRFTIELTDRITPEPSGKYRFCVSKLRPSPRSSQETVSA
jgi:phenylacetate-CoA ligase